MMSGNCGFKALRAPKNCAKNKTKTKQTHSIKEISTIENKNKTKKNIRRIVRSNDSSLVSAFSVSFLRHLYVTARDATAEANLVFIYTDF